MRRWVVLLGLLVTPLAAQRATPGRTEISAMERSFDDRLRRFSLDSPIEVLGLTRGVYLQGYGAVFTAEVNLVQTPGISPFRPSLSKEEVAHVHAAKLKRLPELRRLMREALLSTASSMDRLAAEERVALGVALFYNGWEDAGGLPHTILMEATRRNLLEVASNRPAAHGAWRA